MNQTQHHLDYESRGKRSNTMLYIALAASLVANACIGIAALLPSFGVVQHPVCAVASFTMLAIILSLGSLIICRAARRRSCFGKLGMTAFIFGVISLCLAALILTI